MLRIFRYEAFFLSHVLITRFSHCLLMGPFFCGRFNTHKGAGQRAHFLGDSNVMPVDCLLAKI